MSARIGSVAGAALAVCVCIAAAFAQDAEIIVDVRGPQDPAELNLPEQTERRSLSELVNQLNTAKGDIMLLYTEYTGRAGSDLKEFLRGISEYAVEAVGSVPGRPDTVDHGDCRGLFELRLRKIKLDAYRAASFSGENHHKFLFGHMVVFRMHINKTNDYLKKCDMALHRCTGVDCEDKLKIKRWKRLAAGEIHRLQDDIQHSRRAYKDLVLHARRRLHRLRKQLADAAVEATERYHECLANTRA